MTNSTFFVVRHAEWTGRMTDDEKEIILSPRGVGAATKTAASIKEVSKGKNIRIFSSPRKRALLTAEIISDACNKTEVILDELLSEEKFSADSEDFIDWLFHTKKDDDIIVIVTHEPCCKKIYNLLHRAPQIEMGEALAF